ncbi:hypothetical protein N7495_000172 [Penicillium taxi]|uniref:uncharacterized protein n=1 Tax=Penicillium taxi TaxID=168475 RepID=UPI0025459DE5|nr:uncharacterized protein N7495_000172 [Penicillium taxi]KAJ5907490.1 hypothetical protein N7495_000172 [Penicillium taxi]
MTSDSILYRPTESLLLPNKRRFIPFKIPNFHPQLRNYISTSDPDRIYVVVDRIIYLIQISAQKRGSIAVIPFEPRCMAAGHGWIAVGGPDNGECAYIKIDERGLQVHDETLPLHHSDVDSALPIDLESPSRFLSPAFLSGSSTSEPSRQRAPEFKLHKFGGSIVNSVTIHRFSGDEIGVSDEDLMIISNNDRTVTVYSLTRGKILKILQHQNCMNYATVSPDQTLLATVGDENRAYFYEIVRDWRSLESSESDVKLARWEFKLLKIVEMNIGPRLDDACCFTIAFSSSSRLCAIGSQSGIITVLDVGMLHIYDEEMELDGPVIYQFPASRPTVEGGAVRCMTFSPEPWDLLVWLEAHGRAGIADVRQGFHRRQIVRLERHDPVLDEVHIEPMTEELEGQRFEDEDLGVTPPARLSTIGDLLTDERASLRENLINDLTQRERLIMEFLNTARWPGITERSDRPASLHPPQSVIRLRNDGSTDGVIRTSRPTSPLRSYTHSDDLQDQTGRTGASRRTPLQGWRQRFQPRPPEITSSSHERNPRASLSWTTAPSEPQSNDSDVTSQEPEPEFITQEHDIQENDNELESASSISPEELFRFRSQRPHFPLRRSERPSGTDRRYDPSRLSDYEMRANLAAERLRRQRQAPEVQNRSSEGEQRHRQQLLGFEGTHSPRWIRNIINDLPDRSFIPGSGVDEPDASAGLGWGADGKTLYIATLEGIFEFRINVQDRKTFPVLSCR